jgi:hypothetical protein
MSRRECEMGERNELESRDSAVRTWFTISGNGRLAVQGAAMLNSIDPLLQLRYEC